MNEPRKKKVVIVGISGPSSSGKSTLSRLLRAIIPGAFILHQDDFYKTDEEIPIDPETGYANWDCADALNMDDFVDAMRYIRARDGNYPPTLKSIQEKNELGDPGISDQVIENVRQNFLSLNLLDPEDPAVLLCLVDGFFLYSDPSVVDELDLRFLIRAPYHKLKARREARSGYVTLEGFWEDPPEYFDKIVWKSYVNEHARLFENGDVDGLLKRDVIPNLKTPETLDPSMEDLLTWTMEVISNYLQTIE